MPEGFIPPHGGYQNLLSYQRAEVVYDATVRFCARFLDRRDRTVDQMVQAARSGGAISRTVMKLSLSACEPPPCVAADYPAPNASESASAVESRGAYQSKPMGFPQNGRALSSEGRL